MDVPTSVLPPDRRRVRLRYLGRLGGPLRGRSVLSGGAKKSQ